MLQEGGQNDKCPTSRSIGYTTPAIWEVPNASHRLDKITSVPQVSLVVVQLLPSRGSPTLHMGGQNQPWPTKWPRGYVTLAISGFHNAFWRGTKSELLHKWASWLHNHCRLEVPQHIKVGDNCTSAP